MSLTWLSMVRWLSRVTPRILILSLSTAVVSATLTVAMSVCVTVSSSSPVYQCLANVNTDWVGGKHRHLQRYWYHWYLIPGICIGRSLLTTDDDKQFAAKTISTIKYNVLSDTMKHTQQIEHQQQSIHNTTDREDRRTFVDQSLSCWVHQTPPTLPSAVLQRPVHTHTHTHTHTRICVDMDSVTPHWSGELRP